MALNPSLRLMVANAKAKYGDDLKTATGMPCKSELEAALRLTVMEHLVVLGLRKASKDELRRIILDALAEGATA
ncbi:hypothetical protein [Rhizobium sp. BK491]|uniref:hypothetical protein n=1 Tax=Rhizobium sp. BK491 TaxID=2587009 RepID=UPI00162121F9|nr:hypothetical protein [Rhizobium sp. BK491]MBB3568728.1 hypothetical protein [Rhizobium sp. BK491]